MVTVDNRAIYDENWSRWLDMKRLGPASRWLRSLIHDQVCAIKKRGNIASILDVGCGEGTITWDLAKYFRDAQTTGIDFSSAGIDCARASYSLPRLRYLHDVTSQALDDRYDLVTAFEVLEHVEDWQDLLGRMAAAARQFVLVSFPLGRMRPFEVHVGHLRNFRRGEVEEFMRSKGFRPEQIFQAGFPFYSPLYREACNLTDSASNSFTTGEYGAPQKIVAGVLYSLFRFASTRRRLGDQFCGLFRRDDAP
ncbi:MAG TPA: class I SAM-dependent methyltransferase [Chthoniobacterales bacterium]|nr:class I SAM-dependent methyltransferase [Chthoniobacterales bacterium]